MTTVRISTIARAALGGICDASSCESVVKIGCCVVHFTDGTNMRADTAAAVRTIPFSVPLRCNDGSKVAHLDPKGLREALREGVHELLHVAASPRLAFLLQVVTHFAVLCRYVANGRTSAVAAECFEALIVAVLLWSAR